MAVTYSKFAPQSVTKDDFTAVVRVNDAKCCEVMHPDTNSCLMASYNMMKESVKGVPKFSVPIILAMVALNGRNIDKQVLKEVVWGTCRATIWGATMAATFCLSSCFLRRLLGRYTYYTVSWVPGAIAGLAVFLDYPKRRGMMINTHLIVVLQYFLKAKGWRLPLLQETSLFMLLSALLMYQLRTAPDRSKLYWFFIPPRSTVQDLGQCCSHAGPCWKDIIKGGAKYSALAVVLQLAKIVFSMGLSVVKEPKRAIQRLFSKSTLKRSLSLGGYVFTYKAIHCLLCRRFGKDHPIFDAVAGLFAGSVYALEPRIDAFCSAVVAVLTLFLRRGSEKTFLKKVPAGELLFALCNGVWFHARTMDAANCPPIIPAALDTGSNQLSRKIYERSVGIIEGNEPDPKPPDLLNGTEKLSKNRRLGC